jgi:16S rRNA (cytidine1402-2'-O)-methyltransferase
MEAGTLFLVSTPIGNLSDFSFRALEILKSVEVIAAEDTRHTGILLTYYNIRNKLTSYHDFNKDRVAPQMIDILKEGKSVAVVSDAGTPGISDPAYLLVKLAIEAQIDIQSIPGATAFVSALVISGLPTDRFSFEGFLPPKQGKRVKRLEELSHESRTLIFYESPYRLVKTLKDVEQCFQQRRISVSRELTKKFEETIRGTASQVLEYFHNRKVKGEFVIVIEGKQK